MYDVISRVNAAVYDVSPTLLCYYFSYWSGVESCPFELYQRTRDFYRKPYGEGWALVGDAGCHKDPYMALGIADAFRDVELLSAAIVDGLGGRRPLQEALAGYERQRNEASVEEFQQNLSAARFDTLAPDVFRIREAVRSDPAQATRFSMARFGMIDPHEFFNPGNLQRLLGASI